MIEKLTERKKRESEFVPRGTQEPSGHTHTSRKVSAPELFRMMGDQVKVVRKGTDSEKSSASKAMKYKAVKK